MQCRRVTCAQTCLSHEGVSKLLVRSRVNDVNYIDQLMLLELKYNDSETPVYYKVRVSDNCNYTLMLLRRTRKISKHMTCMTLHGKIKEV